MRGPLQSSVKSREWKRFWFVDCFQSFLPLGSKSCVCYLSKENLLNIYNYHTHTYTKVIFDIVCPIFPWRVQSQFDDLYHFRIYIYKETVILTDHTIPIMPCLQLTFSSEQLNSIMKEILKLPTNDFCFFFYFSLWEAPYSLLNKSIYTHFCA